jgi:hypothetical protein
MCLWYYALLNHFVTLCYLGWCHWSMHMCVGKNRIHLKVLHFHIRFNPKFDCIMSKFILGFVEACPSYKNQTTDDQTYGGVRPNWAKSQNNTSLLPFTHTSILVLWFLHLISCFGMHASCPDLCGWMPLERSDSHTCVIVRVCGIRFISVLMICYDTLKCKLVYNPIVCCSSIVKANTSNGAWSTSKALRNWIHCKWINWEIQRLFNLHHITRLALQTL